LLRHLEIVEPRVRLRGFALAGDDDDGAIWLDFVAGDLDPCSASLLGNAGERRPARLASLRLLA
jgi:hypothetical protein